MDTKNLTILDSNERVLNLNNEEDKKLILEWIESNQDRLTALQDIFNKKYDMSHYKYLCSQEERDLNRTIEALKSIKKQRKI